MSAIREELSVLIVFYHSITIFMTTYSVNSETSTVVLIFRHGSENNQHSFTNSTPHCHSDESSRRNLSPGRVEGFLAPKTPLLRNLAQMALFLYLLNGAPRRGVSRNDRRRQFVKDNFCLMNHADIQYRYNTLLLFVIRR